MKTFADKVIEFNRNIRCTAELPENIRILNPFADNPEINKISEQFYKKFYGDTKPRKMIIGINPGRLGAGSTGIPFTDSKRLTGVCGISIDSVITHEPSSVFMYDMMEQYGGVETFYGDFYINSVSPLGFVIKNSKNNWVNCNYYDDTGLYKRMYSFIIKSLRTQVGFGVDRKKAFVLGKKNMQFVKEINQKENFFEELVQLEHPRYIVQYKSKDASTYINKYIKAFQMTNQALK